MKRITAFLLSFVMILSLLPTVVFAGETSYITQSFDGMLLWRSPNGEFFDTEVGEAFEDWESEILAGYANVRKYDLGTTLQFYADGTINISSVKTPGYGNKSEKIIIEWKMKRTNNAKINYSFNFADLNGKTFATLPFSSENVTISNNYPMGYPEVGTPCAIVAYNNADGESHTVDYYVNKEKVYSMTNESGVFNGFGAINASGNRDNAAWAHIGFADLTVGAKYPDGYRMNTVELRYFAGENCIYTTTNYYITGVETSCDFKEKYFYYDGEVWYAPKLTYSDHAQYNLKKVERYKTKKKGESFFFDGVQYNVTGDSRVVNGNFVTNDTSGWTNRPGTAVNGYIIAYDSEIDENFVAISSGGKDDTNTIGTSWSVVPGEKYYLSFYIGGGKPDARNYQYNQVFQEDRKTTIVPFGEKMIENEWTRFESVFEATGDSIYFMSSWIEDSKYIYIANVELLPVEEYSKRQTKFDVIEDAFVEKKKIYGINNTNTNGVMVASFDDENRGAERDANGETTYLENSTPTTLGSSRVGLMKFPVIDLNENERAILNFYVRDWHTQGFDGGNTFLRIALTPLENSDWANLSEKDTVDSALLKPLSTWDTPVFSEKATNSPGFVKADVTEIMHIAKDAGMENISFKMQIYYGAAYCVERERATGEYDGLNAFVEKVEDTLYKVNMTGSAVLTKNGSAMNATAYVGENDDVRLQGYGKEFIGSDIGVFEANEKLEVSEDMNIENAVPMGFGLKMVDGAQVRYGGGLDEDGNINSGNGLRFITEFDGNETLASFNGAEIGVVITAEQSEDELYIPTRLWQDGQTFTSAITNLKQNNYNRKYTARPYVKVDGKTFKGNGVTRSIYQVASGLLENAVSEGEEAMPKVLIDVLNAYVNQVGIRLTFSDNADFTDWELTAREDGVGSYNGDAFFEIKDAYVDGKIYKVTLLPKGEKTVIKDNWNNYIRINNNNSTVKLCTQLEKNEDGTYTLSFDTGKLGMGTYKDEKYKEMMPTYDRACYAMEKANSYWQENQSYIDNYGGTHPAFWDKAAYHTGNTEMYKLTGKAQYLQYSVDWANYNNWMGNNSTADKSLWTWGYNQVQGSNAVLFGDWQICFQTYMDLYDFGVSGANLERVYEVIDYQITKEEDNFWWWADSLYMVMPVMTKLYARTGDEKYLDALYKYFKYAKELMYDGPGGIPTDDYGYTTSAHLKTGAEYSNPDDYKYLFFRDAGYVYPLNPNPRHETEKNFWARGNGWVFAGLSKVLADMPSTYKHYDEFYQTYVQMAQAVVECQEVDEMGYGFWTQSMLQDYPKGTNGNNEGYETSGTAFLTYGLFWGINNGILKDDCYEKAAVRAWGYLENVALHESGKVGYVQPIGSNATEAVSFNTTANFGVGAYLLACCEAARWAQNR